MTNFERLKNLLRSSVSCVSITTHQEPYILQILRQAAMDLSRRLYQYSFSTGVRDGLFSDSAMEPGSAKPGSALKFFSGLPDNPICVMLDLSALLEDPLTLRVLRETIDRMDEAGGTLVLIDSEDSLPEVIKRACVIFESELPNEQQIENHICDVLRDIHKKTPIEIGITKRGMSNVIRNLRGLDRRQIAQIISETVVEDRRFNDDDIHIVLEGKRRALQSGGLLDYIRVPDSPGEIGGMRNLKKWLNLRKNAFTPSAAEFGLSFPKGILVLGVQGTGKSLCARAVASAWKLPLLRLDPSVLYDKYIGESEHNLINALHQCEKMSPVVLWIDEIEKGFASAASMSSDGGLSRRMFGTLLTWMQEHTAGVFLIATANQIEALPPELLRKGRFDEIFFVDLPGASVRKQIFRIHIAAHGRRPDDYDLDALAEASAGRNGAEIAQAVKSALFTAFQNKAKLSDQGMIESLKASPPLSVTMAEKITELQQWAKGRCVPAD